MVLGLGSNLGDRAAQLRAAVERLDDVPTLRVMGRSSIIETPPFGGPPQPHYLNAAVLVSTSVEFIELLEISLNVERLLGRIRPDPVRWGPRTIDIDLLWCEGSASANEAVLVPHPRLRERAFALQPLLELCPDACDPSTGERYAELPAAHASVTLRGRL